MKLDLINYINTFSNYLIDQYRLKNYEIEESLEAIKNLLTSYINTIQNLKIKNGNDFIYDIYSKADEILKKDFSKEITCKKGCSNCCEIPVNIYNSEANLLFDYLENEIRTKIKTLQIQSRYCSNNWIELKPKYKSCIFLKHNKCSIYEIRPLACRVHYSIDTKEKCKLDIVRENIKFWRPLKISILTFATGYLDNCDYMAIQLLTRIKKNEKI